MITEYCCYGDLLNFLRGKRASFLDPKAGGQYYNVPPGEEGGSGYEPMHPSEKGRSSQSGQTSLMCL